ncbi:MAG: NAD(P)/FAD-dependent oxidoreductase [Lewinellaceae bacterium]|nr:NAD(P)/FAD-dependent oxidoreductase [Saprospiraceae bacterium]MCB9332653.1 NAD(P)/FAD-dependent oxidoreductase [Lewinellaceae bacterium]
MKIAIIGGGAAGFFAAIMAAASPGVQVVILERGKSVLQKVRVSGGGRCNVTHACFEARELIRHYPRGSRELLGPFLRFGPQDTVDWFAHRGVRLKTEADGRMFPVTDDSQTIVSCLWEAAKNAGVQVRTGVRVEKLEPHNGAWLVQLAGKETLPADRVLVASGSNPAVWEMLAGLGLQIVAPVPSLFTFNIKDSRLQELAGISVPSATLAIPGSKLTSQGPLLITHWGLSGPVVLRLSAWGAHELHRHNYHFPLTVSWLGEKTTGEVLAELQDLKLEHARKQIGTYAQFDLPLRLWSRLLAAAGISDGLRWADAGKKQLQKLATELTAGQFSVHGKSTFKEEFVTAGGVALQELNFKTFESKRFPGLFFAGEVLDIDAITGGFNFQAAWTGGWIAGSHMATPR